MKTSELTGATLDWAVEVANDPSLVWGDTIGLHWASHTIVIPALKKPDCYRHSSTDWAQGGPIIEREGINLVKMHGHGWHADCGKVATGPTPLIAATRCYVASKLGDDIEIPEELTK